MAPILHSNASENIDNEDNRLTLLASEVRKLYSVIKNTKASDQYENCQKDVQFSPSASLSLLTKVSMLCDENQFGRRLFAQLVLGKRSCAPLQLIWDMHVYSLLPLPLLVE